MSERFPEIREDVATLLEGDNSGHGMDHVDRVTNMATRFAEAEGADLDAVTLTALLHDVDDYKLFGMEHATNLTNARAILGHYAINEVLAASVLDNIHSMGYSNYLEGRRPKTLEGAVVSDADMCDAIGAQGIVRSLTYNASKGNPFFDKTIPPTPAMPSVDQYRQPSAHTVQHFFDKMLLVPGILMTEAGREEGQKRQKIMVDFLRQTFEEEGSRDWLMRLEEFEN